MPKRRSIRTPQQLWEAISSKSVHFVESLFFRLGVSVARNPWKTIIGTLLFVCTSSICLLRFHIEKNPLNLWVPPDSDYFYDTNWYIDTFGTGFRYQKVIVSADNVLEPDVLRAIHNITNTINSITVTHDSETHSISDLCYQVPVVNFLLFSGNTKTRSAKSNTTNITDSVNSNNDNEFYDPTLWVAYDFYCSFLESFQLVCLQYNILDIWKNDLNEISNINKDDILTKINNVETNPITGFPMDYKKTLGGITYDANGNIVGARSLMLTWFTQVNMSEVDLNEVGNLVGTEDWVSVPLALWETEFLKSMKSISEHTEGVKIFYEAGRSFADVSGDAMFHELGKLFLGILLMFFYIQFALSRWNWLEIRLTLGSVGLLNVGLAYVSAVSWCSLFGASFGPVHSSLPFLLMGLGVDDMFVMNACWKNLSEAEAKKSLPVKVGLMLKHAGVSIVITSFTDIVALLIGAITILPSLKSFCIYAAVGVFFIFCYSVTFYVAVFTLDVMRIDAKRNGIIFCYRHTTEIQTSTEKTMLQRMFESFYKNVVFTLPGKVSAIVFTFIVTGFSIQALLRLEQRFDPKWFIPDDTYYKQYLDAVDLYYPDDGHSAFVFLGDLNYKDEFPNIHNMMSTISKDSNVAEVAAWQEYFHKYVLVNFNLDLRNPSNITDAEFNKYLSKFLFSSIGGRFIVNFKFKEKFVCGQPATRILGSTSNFNFAKFNGPEEYIPAMNKVKNIVKETNITTGNRYHSVWSKVFGNWVTDEIIAVEVERNIELALVCVMVCTVVLITNLQMCFWIFICVALTILNVLGWMQRWGMTVDIVCCIGLELAIGLCVDYAAHVGHTFLTVTEGSRNDRAFKTVTSIGTAVLLGGGSTLLSLSLLSMSKAYTFQSFFKIFLLVILFGLFNGLILLPVVLSLIGPSAYKSKDKESMIETAELNGKLGSNLKQIDDG